MADRLPARVERAGWALLGSAVTLLLLAAVLFPLQAVAVATVALALAETARLSRGR